MLRNFRKPLIIAAPKIGLKHPMAVSPWEDFSENKCFKPIIVKEYLKNASDSLKIVLCSGKISFDI